MKSLKNLFPKITIITPSYNQGTFLDETICSVLNQDYPSLEFIIIDGGSTDNSVEIIKKYEKYLTYWCSEKDAGQTAALMKGFSRATGDVMNWLNSDDLLAPGALKYVAELKNNNRSASIIAAATENFLDGHFEGTRTKSVPSNLTIDAFLFLTKEPPHRHQPGIFFSRNLYEQIGGFSNNYHICMDVDLHLRMIEAGAEVVYSDQTVAFFRQHGDSKTQGGSVRNTFCAVREYMAICDEVGYRTGIKPNHRKGHLRTLLGTAQNALSRQCFADALLSLEMALQLMVLGKIALVKTS